MSILDVAYDALFNKGRKTAEKIQDAYNSAVNTYNRVMNSPEIKYINDTNQRARLAETNADNHIGPAFNEVVRAYEPLTSPHISSIQKGYIWWPNMNEAVDEYNKTLEHYGQHTTGWPVSDDGKYYIQHYMGAQRYGPRGGYAYATKGDKANAIWSGNEYERQPLEISGVKTGADLLRRMDTLTKLHDTIDQTKKGVWQKWNALMQEGKGDTKEAMDYLDQWNKLEQQYFETIRQLRKANSDYRNYVSENSY